ncbi:MAG: efflux RND transporter periplasmic adaptor subunit [Magnetospirillum sp.]|nr:efflux RND transporter periplasmic adaptor subunit [Magnetospirillum sp.]
MRTAATIFSALAFAVFASLASPAAAGELVAHPQRIDDLKAVFGTVESLHKTSARARIGGTLEKLSVVEGQKVEAGQNLGTVVDTKIALQTAAAESRIQSAEAELALARTEYDRSKELFAKGAGTKSRLDAAQTRLQVAERTVSALKSERNVITERGGEGAVLAPNNGRVTKVLVTEGSVVMPGEAIADIAVENYVLRIRLPERHARFIKVGDTVLVGPRALSMADTPPRRGTVSKVYPQIEDGRVIADVTVDGLGDYFVGERVPVHISTGTREAFVVPREAVHRRFGLDYVTLKDKTEVVVQLGQITGDGVEVLAGLRDGDTVVW